MRVRLTSDSPWEAGIVSWDRPANRASAISERGADVTSGSLGKTC